jgi:arylsulfatase
LITLDTTRTDRLGCHGYPHPTSPHLDQLASQAVIYKRAVSTSSWTLPAHASLFTGKFTASHGARYDPDGPLRLTDGIEGPAAWRQYRARGLGPNEATLAVLLRDAGYATGAVVAGPWMKRIFGLHRGFEYYDDDRIGTVNGRAGEDVTRTALHWMDRLPKQPFFLFLNYYDPHAPYAPPEEFARPFSPENGDDLGALYDGEIRYMDHHLGRLLEGLRTRHLYDSTLIVVTADHGELLGEHGKFGHGDYLFQEEIHVPFIVKYPRGEASPRETDTPVQLVDVLPMILDRLELPVPPSVQGGVPPDTGHPIVAEVHPLPFSSPDGEWRAILHAPYKYVWNSQGNHRLFNLENDPKESVNLLETEVEKAARLESALVRYLAALPPPGDAGAPAEVDEETLRALRSLGYVK